MSPPTVTLHVEAIHQAIDEACSSSAADGWRRTHKEDASDLLRLTTSSQNVLTDGFSDTPLYHSLVLENEFGVYGAAIVFISFSTWEGRVLYVNRLVVPAEDTKVPIMRILAKIAVRLDCTRLVWQVQYYLATIRGFLRSCAL